MKLVQLLRQSNIRYWQRSSWNGEAIAGGVLLVDTIGELASLYASVTLLLWVEAWCREVAITSLSPLNMAFPSSSEIHTENFRDIVELFQSRDAARMVSSAELPLVWHGLLSNETERLALGQRAAETLKTQTGATQRTFDALKALLESATPAKAGNNEPLAPSSELVLAEEHAL